MMYDWHGGWGWGGWFLMGFLMLAFWAVIAAVVVALIRGADRRHDGTEKPDQQPADQALRILDERFARGEIDADEYTRRRDLLRAR